MSALAVGFIGAWLLAFTLHVSFFGRYGLGDDLHDGFVKASQSLFVGICVIAWFTHKGHYRMRMPFWTETKQVISAMSFAMLIDIFFRFIVKQDFSRLWMISGWVLATIGILCFRSLWRSTKCKQGTWDVATLLVGRGEPAEEARRALASEPALGFDITTQIDDLPTAFRQAGYSWQTLCAMHKTDYVIFALDGTDLMHTEQAFTQLLRENIPFSVSPPLRNAPVLGMVPHYFFNHDVMLLTHNHGLSHKVPRFIKRSFDIVVSSIALLVLSPLLVTIILLVNKDGGAAFFKQKRLGLNGRTFYCLKFRSMVLNSDHILMQHLNAHPEIQAEWQTYKKLRNGDPRVTHIGKFLRSKSLDELPQLINVLKGDMSLVGPRPILLVELDEYGNDVSHYYRVRPGITGLWQVSGRNNVSYAQRVEMDSWYVRNWSLWHDIAIICKTFPVVFKRDGAY
ncbi:MAG: undecaprenyl-phosphate galactose phosphotransferase WbaP [Alphaproteobacteria bacterium]